MVDENTFWKFVGPDINNKGFNYGEKLYRPKLIIKVPPNI